VVRCGRQPELIARTTEHLAIHRHRVLQSREEIDVTTSVSDTPSSEPKVYVRNATGLVREVSLMDQVIFSASSASPLGAALALGLFYAMVTFPRANILLALAIAIGLSVFVWVAFALLAAAMPKVGGDYIYNSRIVHPFFGMASNMSMYIGTALIIGLWAYWFAALGVVPAFAIIGTVTGHEWWINTSETLSSKNWLFALAALGILIVSALAVYGTKLVVRTMTVLYILGFIGLAISFFILLFTSKSEFIKSVNDFSEPFSGSPDTYHDTIKNAEEGGLALPGSSGGYSTRSTIGTIYVGFTVILFVWIGTYLAGEFRGAGQRKRQLISIVGAGVGQGLLLLLTAAVFLRTAGYDFLAAANYGSYPVPVPPYFNFFASVIAPNDILAIFLGLVFIAWFLPAININVAMCQRAPLAWAFDGVFPRVFARVSERTHTPVVSIMITTVIALGGAAWATYSSTFLEAFAIVVLVSFVTILCTGLAAFVMPRLRPELYRHSPADWRLFGVPVLPIAGVGCALVAVFAMVEILYFDKELAVTHFWWAVAAPILTSLAGVVVYVVARAVRKQHGVNLDLVYKTIPPD
jgi:amino acid transporter